MKPGVLPSMGLQKIGHDLETEQQEQMYNEFLKSNLDALWYFDPSLEPDEVMSFIQ